MNDITETSQAKSTQFRNLIIFAMVVMTIFALFVWMLSQQTKEGEKAIDKASFSNPLEHADSETIVLERVQKNVEETIAQTEKLKKQLDEKINSKDIFDEAKQKQLETRLNALEQKMSANQNAEGALSNDPSSTLAGSQNYQGRVLPRPGAYRENVEGSTDDPGMREDKLLLMPTEEELRNRRPIKNPNTYVPAGTFAQAIVIGGADASAAVNAQADPSVMLFRIVAPGTLPNHKKSHLKDCVFTAAAVGDISSERGRIRTERLSCVFPNGQVFDEAVEGTVFGPDGKNDVRGNRREGGVEYVGRAFAAGTLSGLSEGLSQTYTANSISPEGNVQTVNSGKIFQYGAAKGAGKAMDKLADYNIKRAEQFHPVIQLSAGTVVDVVFLKGFFLDGKKHEAEEKEAPTVPNMFETQNNPPATTAFLSQDEKTLPLSAEQVKRLQERSKELGLRVSGDVAS